VSPSFRPARLALGAALAIGAVAIPATSAQALSVSSTPEGGLQMREPNNTLNRIDLSIVDGGAKYRIEMPEFGGRGLSGGPNCTLDEPRPGVNVAICERITPKVSVNMGSQGDTFKVDPSFPDPIDIFGGLGNDGIQLGAGNDTAKMGAGGGSIRGNGGNDTLEGGNRPTGIAGGDGNDTLIGRGFDTLVGGPGNDTLRAAFRVERMTGGDGVDTFEPNGLTTTVDSRDGIAEQVTCGVGSRRNGAPFRQAIVDLVDQPGDDALGCDRVDRAPNAEKTSVSLKSKRLKAKRGRVALKVRCTTSRRCTGKARVTVGGNRSKAVSYRIRGKRTGTVRIKLPAGAKGRTATVVLTEKGQAGARNIQAKVPLKR
jgi:hypothetical protein